MPCSTGMQVVCQRGEGQSLKPSNAKLFLTELQQHSSHPCTVTVYCSSGNFCVRNVQCESNWQKILTAKISQSTSVLAKTFTGYIVNLRNFRTLVETHFHSIHFNTLTPIHLCTESQSQHIHLVLRPHARRSKSNWLGLLPNIVRTNQIVRMLILNS